MISKTLMKQTIKANITLWAIMTVVQSLCLALMAGIGQPVALTGVAFYNMLPGILSGIYIIVTSNKLLAAQVDKGTMAYVLSTPIKRSNVAITQMVYMIGSLFAMFAICAATHIVATVFASGSISAGDVVTIIKLNSGLFALGISFSGICFLASGFFNLSKHAIALGGGLVGTFLLLPSISMFGEHFAFLGKLTPVALYDINSIMAGTGNFIWECMILAGIGIVTYLIGTVSFVKKDLPL